MTCKEIENLFPDYLQKSLGGEKLSAITAHLEQCPECSATNALWAKLGTMPHEIPPAILKTRFDAMLNAYQEGRWEHDRLKNERKKLSNNWLPFDWFRAPAAQVA